ncbi:MAG: NADH oxidase/thioredoxin reductase, partial [Candidatus Gottesmanbacteria bacterium GW2011_GWC2_42_8]
GKVYIIYRGSQLRGDPIWLIQIEKNPKIEVIYATEVLEIKGDGEKLTGVVLKSTGEKLLSVDKVFIEIGGVPGTALVIPLGVAMDKGGYIKVDDKLATNIPGIFAAGDLVSYGLSIEQISTAVGLGARAAASAFAYLKEEKAPILWGQSLIKR